MFEITSACFPWIAWDFIHSPCFLKLVVRVAVWSHSDIISSKCWNMMKYVSRMSAKSCARNWWTGTWSWWLWKNETRQYVHRREIFLKRPGARPTYVFCIQLRTTTLQVLKFVSPAVARIPGLDNFIHLRSRRFLVLSRPRPWGGEFAAIFQDQMLSGRRPCFLLCPTSGLSKRWVSEPERPQHSVDEAVSRGDFEKLGSLHLFAAIAGMIFSFRIFSFCWFCAVWFPQNRRNREYLPQSSRIKTFDLACFKRKRPKQHPNQNSYLRAQKYFYLQNFLVRNIVSRQLLIRQSLSLIPRFPRFVYCCFCCAVLLLERRAIRSAAAYLHSIV